MQRGRRPLTLVTWCACAQLQTQRGQSTHISIKARVNLDQIRKILFSFYFSDLLTRDLRILKWKNVTEFKSSGNDWGTKTTWFTLWRAHAPNGRANSTRHSTYLPHRIESSRAHRVRSANFMLAGRTSAWHVLMTGDASVRYLDAYKSECLASGRTCTTPSSQNEGWESQPQLQRENMPNSSCWSACWAFFLIYPALVHLGVMKTPWTELSNMSQKAWKKATEGSWTLNLQILLIIFLLLFKNKSLEAVDHALVFFFED